MAKTNGNGGGADSWPGFLSDLTKNFLILRDIFGYALSGAVFFSIGLLCQRFSLADIQRFLAPYHLPAWLGVVFGVGACYTVGHLMNQAAFLFDNTWKGPYCKDTWQFQWPRPLSFRKVPKEELTELQRTKAVLIKLGEDTWQSQWRWRCLLPFRRVPKKERDDAQTREAALIKLRADHPAVLIELERQSIMTQLRGSVGAAMLSGCLLFYVFPTPPIGAMVGVAGVFLLIVFWSSARPHIRELKDWTKEAGAAAPPNHAPAAQAQAANDPDKCKQALDALITAAQEAAKKL